MKRIMIVGTRRLVSLLCGLVVFMGITAAVYAHSINGVDSITSGKKIEFGSASLVSGSITVSHSLAGTPTVAFFEAVYTSVGNGSGTTFRHKITGTNSVTFYAYNGGDVSGTSTNDFDGSYFLGK